MIYLTKSKDVLNFVRHSAFFALHFLSMSYEQKKQK